MKAAPGTTYHGGESRVWSEMSEWGAPALQMPPTSKYLIAVCGGSDIKIWLNCTILQCSAPPHRLICHNNNIPLQRSGERRKVGQESREQIASCSPPYQNKIRLKHYEKLLTLWQNNATFRCLLINDPCIIAWNEGYLKVSNSRPSLMIIASASQFHVYLLWGQCPFSIVSW